MSPLQASEGKWMWQREQRSCLFSKLSHKFYPLRGAIPPTSATFFHIDDTLG